MAKITIKATLHLSCREILMLQRALTQFKLSCSDFEKTAVADLIELTEHWHDRIKWEREKAYIAQKVE